MDHPIGKSQIEQFGVRKTVGYMIPKVDAAWIAVKSAKMESKVLWNARLEDIVAESFFQLLKRERIRRRIYADREEAKRDIFDYIEMFYNPKRLHSYADGLSPVQFEQQYFNRLRSVY